MASTCQTGNFYAALQSLTLEECDDESLTEEDEGVDSDFQLSHYEFDLLATEEQCVFRPVFTRELLQQIAADVAYIMPEQIKPKNQRGKGVIKNSQSNGLGMTVWQGIGKADSVTIHYLTRIEMLPTFRKRFGALHERTKLLRSLNKDMTEDEFINHVTTPYFIESFHRLPNTIHNNASLMHHWRIKLKRTQSLWIASSSCSHLLDIISRGASMLESPVTRIVCVGLGKLNVQPEWYQSAPQHMTVFSIAAALDKLNKARFKGCRDVEIIAQDPCYEEKDFILLQELAPTRITFAHDDPNTLLAIDENTLLVSAYLPTSMPLAQIVADLSADGKGKMKGPAMMLWDKMDDVRIERRWYCMRDRSSPGVARMLQGYVKWRRGFGALDERVEKNIRGKGKGRWRYWLEDMDLWVRRDVN
ncbi:hypothetical protein FB567DRAFT_604758 [Paraphoma chrysanthemicola]|uniref:SRR1-like domain-containing protein n=1 Tax=Paraphoma chrysanthemicola TaxID=798071 RepID=A0A8K0VX38_9PLEO|nr:hypothetical protein FB567DRAFT_604758 [Paraphoma chrysanthemicola]